MQVALRTERQTHSGQSKADAPEETASERPSSIAALTERYAPTSDLDVLRLRASRFFAALLWLHVPVVALIAASNGLPVWRVALIMSLAALAGTIAARRGSSLAARLTIAAALTVVPALMVYAGQGPWQIDWHMYFFVVFGMLVVYVDWRPIALSAGITAVHHLLLDLAFPAAVFPESGLGRVALHAGIVVVACLTLFWICSLMRRLFVASAVSLKAAQDAAAEAQRLESYAKHGSDLIMQAVNQGLLLCDEQFCIQPQYSSELEQIFETEQLAGRDLLELLKGLLSERLFRTTSDYAAMLFDSKKKERTVLRVNPLSEVECTFSDPAKTGFTSKYLSFSFRRIVEDGKVVRVFVAVNDITERVKLERQLHEAERRKDRQVEFLLSFVRIEGTALRGFIASAKEQILSMDDSALAQDFAAANAGRSELLRKRLDTIFRCVHNIKGNAALIKFDYFERRAEEFEETLSEIRNRDVHGGDDYLSIVFVQSELRSDIEELEDLGGKFPSAPQRREIATADRDVPSADDMVVAVGELAKTIAKKLGKEVRVDAAGFDTRHLDAARRRVVKDVLIQLTRNSLAHGVELPETRQLTGKDRRATLTIRSLSDRPSEFAFTFRDDGRGFPMDQIRRRAVERGLLTGDPNGCDDSKIAKMIFEPGFSTADEATPDAGRGMGMSIVKDRIVDEYKGDISFASEAGRFCEFKIAVPIVELAHV